MVDRCLVGRQVKFKRRKEEGRSARLTAKQYSSKGWIEKKETGQEERGRKGGRRRS
jgi:hypothetical protein